MKSILFSAPMILALRDGKKDVTRRLKTKLKAGDLVYVKEAWRLPSGSNDIAPRDLGLIYDDFTMRIRYECDGATNLAVDGMNWGRVRSSLHMPEWASRFRLRIVDVRKERLMDITDEDAVREGIEAIPQVGMMRAFGWKCYLGGWGYFDPTHSFASLWDSINGAGSFATNPEVYRIEFEKEVAL